MTETQFIAIMCGLFAIFDTSTLERRSLLSVLLITLAGLLFLKAVL